VIGLDTNVLARYYAQEERDGEASKQRESARRLMVASGDLSNRAGAGT